MAMPSPNQPPTPSRGLGGIVRDSLSDGIPRRSFYVAVVVGTVLNLINQHDALIGEVAINWLKVGLTYVVPYCVATYGAVTVLCKSRD